jgi:hypothetical protein
VLPLHEEQPFDPALALHLILSYLKSALVFHPPSLSLYRYIVLKEKGGGSRPDGQPVRADVKSKS